MTPTAAPQRPTRRGLLAGALLVPLVACSSRNASGGDGVSPQDQALIRETGADEQRLLAAYEATAARHPDLLGVLAVPWQQHREHAASLGVPASPVPATPPSVPATSAAATASLAALELSVGAARVRACGSAGHAFAPLLGSIAAAELVHANVTLQPGGGT